MLHVFDDFNHRTRQLEYHHEEPKHDVEVGPISGFRILSLLMGTCPFSLRHQEEDSWKYEAQDAHGDG
jgi:hypothetical protein